MFNRTQIFFSVLGIIHGYNWRKLRKFVYEFQYWDDDSIRQYQESRLQKLINHAYHNVAYYRKQFDQLGIKPSEIQSLEDLEKIPVIDKETVRDNRNDFMAKNFKSFKPVSRATGGTTGLAFKFYSDRYSWALNWAVKMRTFNQGGYEPGKHKLGVLAGGSLLPQNKGSLKKRLWRWIMNYHSMPISHMTDQTLETYLSELKAKRIKFLRGYPTAIYTLAKYIDSKGETLPLTAIFTTAEMLYQHHRAMFRRVFLCETFNEYGAGDGLGKAHDCQLHNAMHLAPELSITNIVNPKGTEVENDQEGELVFTSLVDFAMPFIRYKPGDLAVKCTDKCTCGANTPIIKEVIGRSSDLIELSNGRRINGLSIPFEAWTEQVEKFQIVQTDYDKVELNIIPKPEFGPKEKAQAQKVMEFHCGEGIMVKINIVDYIEVPISGKFRYVISKFNFN